MKLLGNKVVFFVADINNVQASNDVVISIYNHVFKILEEHYEDGYDTFLTPTGGVFETIILNAILEMKKIYKEIKIGYIIPNKKYNLFITPNDELFNKEISKISDNFDISIFLTTPYEKNDFLSSFCDKMMTIINNK